MGEGRAVGNFPFRVGIGYKRSLPPPSEKEGRDMERGEKGKENEDEEENKREKGVKISCNFPPPTRCTGADRGMSGHYPPPKKKATRKRKRREGKGKRRVKQK